LLLSGVAVVPVKLRWRGIETVVMTAEQYERAVNALATLIVEWTTALAKHGSGTGDHPSLD
jgi:hypothetical protein